MTKKQFDKEFIAEQERLLRSASFLINDEDLAEDIVQKTYCLGIEKLKSYKEQGAFFPWLNTIMRHIYFSDHKRNKRRRHIFESIKHEDLTTQMLDCRYLADAHIFNNSRKKRLKLAFNNIPFKYQRVLKLKVEEELSYKQIALREKIKYGTVKSRISRGKSLLKKCINEEFSKTDYSQENIKNR